MEKCSCWEEKYKLVGWYNAQTPILSNQPTQICNGTKEREECSCNGDESKCNFYPEKRKENKIMNTAEMWLKAQKDGKTYSCDNMQYDRKHGFCFNTGLKIKGFYFDCPENIFELNWQLKSDN